MRSRWLLLYVALVDLLALGAILVAPSGGAHGWTVLILAGLGGLVGLRPVRVPALRTEVTSNDAFALCALAALGPQAAALVSVAGVLGAALGLGRRPAPIRLAFNLGAVPFSAMIAGAAYAALGGRFGATLQSAALPLAAATSVYFIVNTGLVTGAIALEKSQPFFEIWKRSFLWTAVAAFTGLSLAAALLGVLDFFGTWMLVVGVPPAWLLATFYKKNQSRIEEQDGRIETVEGLNQELEQKVAERTRSLQEVLSHLESMNRQLRESNERLVEASRTKSQFLANVSHELRTPLNAVIGFSDLLADSANGALNERQGEFLKDVRDSGEHLLNLINNILDLSKIEAGRLEANPQDVRIPEVLREGAAMLHPLASRKEIEIRIECPAEVTGARIDPGMFREVLANLLSNAVKFTPEKGHVQLVARREGNDLRVEVQDDGIGIAPEDQARIFEEFYQVDGSYSRNYEGTGLGLALVQRMMKLHGGEISVQSVKGEGSRFTCVFPDCLLDLEPRAVPAAERKAAHVAPAGAPTSAEPRTRTILVVEDNALNRKLARNALRSRGHNVVEASSGEQALALLRKSKPDLVLMDLQLPGIDGLELTRRLKSDPATANLTIVALTAHTQALDEDRARSAGCAGYITKPIRLTYFPTQIETYFVPREGVA